MYTGQSMTTLSSHFCINSVVGLLMVLWNLNDFTSVTSLLCEIHGEMDASNLNLMGFALPPNAAHQNSLRKKSPANKSVSPDKLYAVLTYSPKAARSFFFTFAIDLSAAVDSIISMDAPDPVHLDQHNNNCSVFLPGFKCLTGTTTGRLIVWDIVDHRIVGSYQDTSVVDMLPTPRKPLQKPRNSASAEKAAQIICVCVTSPDTVASASANGKVKLWNSTKMQFIKELGRSSSLVGQPFTFDRRLYFVNCFFKINIVSYTKNLNFQLQL